MASVENTLLDNAVTVISSLSLQLPDQTPATVRKGKLPKAEEDLDPLPIIYVYSATKNVTAHWYTTANDKLKEYHVEIAIIAKGNRDNKTNLDTYLDWRQQINRALTSNPGQIGLSITDTQVLDVEEQPGIVIQRAAWLAQYDVSILGIKFWVIEPANKV